MRSRILKSCLAWPAFERTGGWLAWLGCLPEASLLPPEWQVSALPLLSIEPLRSSDADVRVMGTHVLTPNLLDPILNCT